MIGILIFTHGQLCRVLHDEAERLSGHRDHVKCVSMREGESVEELVNRVDRAVADLDTGNGVLAICDVAGGTPWNVCGQLRKRRERNVRRLGGVSMPIIIKALQDHGEHSDLDAWVADLTRYGLSRVVSD